MHILSLQAWFLSHESLCKDSEHRTDLSHQNLAGELRVQCRFHCWSQPAWLKCRKHGHAGHWHFSKSFLLASLIWDTSLYTTYEFWLRLWNRCIIKYVIACGVSHMLSGLCCVTQTRDNAQSLNLDGSLGIIKGRLVCPILFAGGWGLENGKLPKKKEKEWGVTAGSVYNTKHNRLSAGQLRKIHRWFGQRGVGSGGERRASFYSSRSI